ncbi:TPA: helicase, partial [Streptococcus equi subsp. equi]|nr:helicase [Streptococcus equi subsp. equi]
MENDHRNAGSGLSEIHRTEEELGYDTNKNGYGTDHLGIDEYRKENIQKIEQNHVENEEKEVERTSFSFAQNVGVQGRFELPMQQEEIGAVLIHGGNEDNLHLKVLAEYSKEKSMEELADFLQKTFQGGNGYELNGNKVCAWYEMDGIHLSNDVSSRENPMQILPWKDAAIRIGELIDYGKYSTNVEVAEAFSFERAELSEKLWFLKGDLSDEVKNQFLPILNEKQRNGYPEKTEYLTKKLEDKEFRVNLKEEYIEFFKAYKENSNVLRFHNHDLDDISKRLDDLELPRKEFTSTLIELPAIQGFITEDEIDRYLSSGSNVSGGKERIYNFFREAHTTEERA